MIQESENHDVEAPPGGRVIDEHLPRRFLALAAEIADRLLSADDAAAMVGELFEIIRRELSIDVFFNYKIEGQHLILEAFGGLTEQQARDGAILELGQAVCGCVARDRVRHHATHVQASDDPLVAFVKSVGLDAYACTPLIHGSDLLGTLGFGRKRTARFTQDELHFLHTICHYVALAKHRLRVEQELRERILERERLISELNHRVRNSLQIAISLVAIEARVALNEEAAGALSRTRERFEVLASAHRPLYAGAVARDMEMLEVLSDAVIGDAEISINSQPCWLPAQDGIVLALLVRSLLNQPGKAKPILTTIAETNNARLAVTLHGRNWGRSDLPEIEERICNTLLRRLRAALTFTPEGVGISVPLI